MFENVTQVTGVSRADGVWGKATAPGLKESNNVRIACEERRACP